MLHCTKILDGGAEKYIVQCNISMIYCSDKDSIMVEAAKKTGRIAKPKPAVAGELPPVMAQEIITPEAPITTQATPKETPMTKTATPDFVSMFTSAFAGVQEKAQAAVAKSTEAFGEYNAFAKGNVEALIESGKILAAGVQEMGTSLVAEGRSAFETATGEAKDLAAVKSPTDFFKLQSELIRKQFDSVVAFGSKQTEASMKLASEVAAPLSTRVNLAVEKVKKAA
jgi:phasin family protein